MDVGTKSGRQDEEQGGGCVDAGRRRHHGAPHIVGRRAELGSGGACGGWFRGPPQSNAGAVSGESPLLRLLAALGRARVARACRASPDPDRAAGSPSRGAERNSCARPQFPFCPASTASSTCSRKKPGASRPRRRGGQQGSAQQDWKASSSRLVAQVHAKPMGVLHELSPTPTGPPFHPERAISKKCPAAGIGPNRGQGPGDGTGMPGRRCHMSQLQTFPEGE